MEDALKTEATKKKLARVIVARISERSCSNVNSVAIVSVRKPTYKHTFLVTSHFPVSVKLELAPKDS